MNLFFLSDLGLFSVMAYLEQTSSCRLALQRQGPGRPWPFCCQPLYTSTPEGSKKLVAGQYLF